MWSLGQVSRRPPASPQAFRQPRTASLPQPCTRFLHSTGTARVVSLGANDPGGASGGSHFWRSGFSGTHLQSTGRVSAERGSSAAGRQVRSATLQALPSVPLRHHDVCVEGGRGRGSFAPCPMAQWARRELIARCTRTCSNAEVDTSGGPKTRTHARSGVARASFPRRPAGHQKSPSCENAACRQSAVHSVEGVVETAKNRPRW